MRTWIALLIACSVAGAADARPWQNAACNYTVDIPPGFSLSRHAGDRAVLQEDRPIRTPLRIDVLCRPTAANAAADWRKTSAGQIAYRVERRPAVGSGGALWTITIFHPITTVIGARQSELGRPSFKPVWDLALSLRR